MAGTVNFTGAVDRELLKRAKIIAAKSETSVNALFNAELRYLVETFEAAEASEKQLNGSRPMACRAIWKGFVSLPKSLRRKSPGQCRVVPPSHLSYGRGKQPKSVF